MDESFSNSEEEVNSRRFKMESPFNQKCKECCKLPKTSTSGNILKNTRNCSECNPKLYIKMYGLKQKRLLRPSKLKFISSEYPTDVRLKYVTKNILFKGSSKVDKNPVSKNCFLFGSPCLNKKYKRMFSDEHSLFYKKSFIKKSKLFKSNLSGKDTGKLPRDFKSLSLSDISAETTEKVSKPFKFSKLGSIHRGNRLKKFKHIKSECDNEMPNLKSLSLSENSKNEAALSCSEQARSCEDVSTDELAAYFDNMLYFPQKMSFMAEMMYT